MHELLRFRRRALAIVAIAVVALVLISNLGKYSVAGSVLGAAAIAARFGFEFWKDKRRRQAAAAERALIARAQAGDPAALQVLHERYQDLAEQYAGPRANELLVDLNCRIGRFDLDGEASFGAFVVAVFRSSDGARPRQP